MFKLQLLVLLDWSCKEPAFLCLLVYLLLLVFFLFLFGCQYRLCWLFVTYLFLFFALVSFYEFKYFLESHVIANILLLIRIRFRFRLWNILIVTWEILLRRQRATPFQLSIQKVFKSALTLLALKIFLVIKFIAFMLTFFQLTPKLRTVFIHLVPVFAAVAEAEADLILDYSFPSFA